jgi:GT2 family glycosyltransferase
MRTDGLSLSVILVSYNALPYLEACLRSLTSSLAAVEHEIIVVDNASEDGSAAVVERTFPQVHLIRNRENLGYPRANNQGIAAAGGEYVLLLNPDTEVLPGALDHLMAELHARSRAGAAAPILRLPSGRIQVSFGWSVNFLSEFAKKLILNRYLSRWAETHKAARKVGWLGGACILIRREVLELVGGFDETFFLYFEDIDLCYRIRDMGFDLYLVPKVEIRHVGGASTSGLNLLGRFHYRRSQLRFYRKHASPLSRWCLKGYLWLDFWGLYFRGKIKRAADMDLRKRFFGLLREP